APERLIKVFGFRMKDAREHGTKIQSYTTNTSETEPGYCSERFHLASLPAASVLPFAITLASDTGAPPWRLLSSAAYMKAKISIVSSARTGGLPVLKKRPISVQSSS